MAAAAVRTASTADLAGVLALYRHLHPSDPLPGPEAASTAWSAILRSGTTTLVVADLAGRIVSSCMVVVTSNLTRGARPFALIENVVTDPAHRRAGLGRAVLCAALEIAWTAGCYKVMLTTGSRNPETLRFYASAGLVPGAKTYFEARRPPGA